MNPLRRSLPPCSALLLAALVLPSPVASAGLGAPTLKWAYGGCFSSWCQTGWYASPVVADIDGDGAAEVAWASYDFVLLDGKTGSLEKRVAGSSRAWPGLALADLTGDGSLEIVVGRGGSSGQVVVHDRLGEVVRTMSPFSAEVRTLAVDDLDGDGTKEIVVGRASGGSYEQVDVLEPSGTTRPGWPARRTGEPGYGWGMYNENLAIADMDGDGDRELFAPTDTHFVTALDDDGNQLPANSMYGTGKVWSEVGTNVDLVADLRGWTECETERRPNFANCSPAVGDVDGDGTLELVLPGDVYDCSIGDPDGDLYVLPWILRLDRSRWAAGSYDWTVIPAPGASGGPLSEDYSVIENAVHNAVLADLDGDGRLEILIPSYDGKLHAWWLDKTEHGSWPVVVTGNPTPIRFAGEPAVADLDDDGQAEVIFTSWPEKGSGERGKLHVVSSMGVPLFSVDLPVPRGDSWNGGLAAPTLANVDDDPELEAVVGTVSSGVAVYDLPGSAGARVLWRTGRGSFARSGQPAASLPTEASGAGHPLRVVDDGAALQASYTPACGARDHAIFRGSAPSGGPATWSGVVCGLGTSGHASFDPGSPAPNGLILFVVVGQTPTAEGSYGRSSTGAERPEATGLGVCDHARELGGSCG
jgi:hypothetical protein